MGLQHAGTSVAAQRQKIAAKPTRTTMVMRPAIFRRSNFDCNGSIPPIEPYCKLARCRHLANSGNAHGSGLRQISKRLLPIEISAWRLTSPRDAGYPCHEFAVGLHVQTTAKECQWSWRIASPCDLPADSQASLLSSGCRRGAGI